MPRKPEYIGDGVYLDDDGFQIWLCLNSHDNRVIALEDSIVSDFIITIVRRLIRMGLDSMSVLNMLKKAIESVESTKFGD